MSCAIRLSLGASLVALRPDELVSLLFEQSVDGLLDRGLDENLELVLYGILVN